VGVHDPDYQLALDQLGVIPEQSVFVGHKAVELDGAKNVGMKTVAFNYDRDAKADFYIKSFSELTSLSILN
jgi:FMN phosphatase YigB (HAD superfamily)